MTSKMSHKSYDIRLNYTQTWSAKFAPWFLDEGANFYVAQTQRTKAQEQETIEAQDNAIASIRENVNTAIENVKPVLETKGRRVGGATYQVPMEIRPERRQTLAIRWLVFFARKRNGERKMEEKVAGEILDAYNNTGASIKRRDEMHRMAEANKAFAHYKW